MIPKQIQIKNFLSYGPETQTIDFGPYNLICLSGKNGHGKSALLDAITWSIWGQARKTNSTSKADEGLVHLGQKHMLIVFDFEINNIAYRIRREFVKTQSNPFSALDFGIVNADGSLTALTDKTIKTTQTKIEKTIGITYDCFINSAFLRQGQANEFSKKSPKERKEILATILQLDRFEDLKKIALEKSKLLQLQLLTKQNIGQRIVHEITELQTTLLEKDAHLKLLQEIEEQEIQLNQIIVADEQKKELLLADHKKYEFIQLQKTQEEKHLIEVTQQVEVIQSNYQQIVAAQQKLIDMTLLETEQKRLSALISIHQEKLNKRLELKDQYLTLQEKKQLIEKEIHQTQTELVQKYEINEKIIHEQIDQLQRKLKDHADQLEKYKVQLTLLNKEITQISHQNCPMCEQVLSTQHKDIVLKKLTASIELEQKNITIIQTQLATLHKNLELNKIAQKNATNQPLDEHKDSIYQALLKKIDVLKQTGQSLAYDKEMHEKDFKQLQLVQAQLATYQTLQKEMAQQEQRLKQITDLQATILKIKDACTKLDQELFMIKDCPILLAEHIKIQQAHKAQAQTIGAQKLDLLNKKTIFDLHHKKMIQLQTEQVLIEKEITSLNLEMADFAEIVKALGKDGLQALLIEQALPEIEQDANILLAQLTDNQTQIFIESLKDLKKGGSKETLDIKISDAIGLRPYEMFSGGEAFRIDFALRIAISKLLARRAGTALQTLIIDEGFGSQDDDGLQLIMDSILKIQDNFAKVIIVSHLPSMKEQFPVQFIVEKKASGSFITIIQQG